MPEGFEDRLVASVEKPTAMAFTPDGRMLITTKDGQLRVRKNGTSATTKALDISGRICTNSERGLLDVAVDPDFESNGYVYLYYTTRVGPDCDASPRDERNRVSRFVMTGDTVVASSEKILIGAIRSTGGNHNAGDLHFGKDGYLYASVGDGGTDYKDGIGGGGSNDAARDNNVLLGKILRVTRDGGVPADNPFTGPDGARCYDPAPGGNKSGRVMEGKNCSETFAKGLRNPFRMAFDPDAAGTQFFINDVGQHVYEEIDKGKSGADYGWNLCEGRDDNPDSPGSVNCTTGEYTPPIHQYSHSTGCSSITGASFVPDAAPWPSSYDEAYLFGDYVCGKIFKLVPKDGGGYQKTLLAGGLGRGGPTAMTFGPSGSSQALYYATFAEGGQIRRISYTTGNHDPNAVAKVTNENYGPQAKEFNFSSDGSNDQDGDQLTFDWDFDYTEGSFTQDATGPTVFHTYDTSGKKVTAVRALDGKGGQDISTVEVFPGDTAPPVPTIENPTEGTTFKVGQQISLRGSATDADEPGAQPSLKWEVLRHHDNSHAHPYFDGSAAEETFTAPAPEDLLSTDPQRNYLEIQLTATDSEGLSRSVTRRLEPRTTNVRFATRPTNLRLVVNGRDIRAPRTLTSWEGYRLTVNAPRQRYDGRSYVFGSWSDGRAAQHTILTPPSFQGYTATFRLL